MIINFYRGLKSLYKQELHGTGIYFTTDTLEIIHNGKSYSGIIEEGKYVKDISINEGIMTIIYTDGTSTTANYQVELVDNLESDSSDKALSAKQGKLLKLELDEVKTKLTKVYTYKGSKNSYEELPDTANVGDVWNVVSSYNGNPAGTNYAWVEDILGGGHWDALGGTIDFSNYYDKSTVDQLILEETIRAQEEESKLSLNIEANTKLATEAKTLALENQSTINKVTDQIDSLLNGSDETNQIGIIDRLDAVENIIGTNETDGTILQRLTLLETLNNIDPNIIQNINNNTLEIIALKETVYGTDLQIGLVNQVETLNGDDTTQGSIDYKIAQAFAWVEV